MNTSNNNSLKLLNLSKGFSNFFFFLRLPKSMEYIFVQGTVKLTVTDGDVKIDNFIVKWMKNKLLTFVTPTTVGNHQSFLGVFEFVPKKALAQSQVVYLGHRATWLRTQSRALVQDVHVLACVNEYPRWQQWWLDRMPCHLLRVKPCPEHAPCHPPFHRWNTRTTSRLERPVRHLRRTTSYGGSNFRGFFRRLPSLFIDDISFIRFVNLE